MVFYTGACYFTPMIGGYLTDRLSWQDVIAITLGGITMAIGNLTLFSMQNQIRTIPWISTIIIGNGFFKPNISTLVGELYDENDPKRDSAFTIFYMGINVGAFFAPLICGFLAEDFFKTTVDGVMVIGYNYGFLAASIGMIIGQIVFNLLVSSLPWYIGTTSCWQKNRKSTCNWKYTFNKTRKTTYCGIL